MFVKRMEGNLVADGRQRHERDHKELQEIIEHRNMKHQRDGRQPESQRILVKVELEAYLFCPTNVTGIVNVLGKSACNQEGHRRFLFVKRMEGNLVADGRQRHETDHKELQEIIEHRNMKHQRDGRQPESQRILVKVELEAYLFCPTNVTGIVNVLGKFACNQEGHRRFLFVKRMEGNLVADVRQRHETDYKKLQEIIEHRNMKQGELLATMERMQKMMSGALEEIREKLFQEGLVLNDRISAEEADLCKKSEEPMEAHDGKKEDESGGVEGLGCRWSWRQLGGGIRSPKLWKLS